MMAKMLEPGKDVRYYENIEGGHGGAANNAQAAHMSALAYTFLWQQLGQVTDVPCSRICRCIPARNAADAGFGRRSIASAPPDPIHETDSLLLARLS